MLSGTSTQAGTVLAYVQSLFNSKAAAWVGIPPMLQPQYLRGKYDCPVCRLIKALYVNPECGAQSEQHLAEAIKRCGGAPVEKHPS
eukprot:4957642-Karenia_brevis.AAC.1